jgi:hypothetical protein
VEQWRKYDLAMQEILHLAGAKGFSEMETQRFLLRLILKSRELPEPAKLTLIDRLTRPQTETAVALGSLTPAERGQVQRWLKQYIIAVTPKAVHKPLLQEVQQRLAEPASVLE